MSGLVLSRHARTGAEDKAAGKASFQTSSWSDWMNFQNEKSELCFQFRHEQVKTLCTCESSALEAEFWTGEVKFAAVNLAPGLCLKDILLWQRSLCLLPYSFKVIHCHSAKTAVAREEEKERTKRGDMGENAPASLSAERNKAESMIPLFCKTRGLDLKHGLQQEVLD